jgi:hypothetical protein
MVHFFNRGLGLREFTRAAAKKSSLGPRECVLMRRKVPVKVMRTCGLAAQWSPPTAVEQGQSIAGH